MQRSKTVSFLLLFTICSLTSGRLGAQAAQPQPKKVLDDMIQTLGGQDFLDVKDIHLSGRLYQFKRGDLSGSDLFADYVKFPMAERVEFGRDKNKEITVNNGAEGWKLQPKDKVAQEQLPGEIQEFTAGFKTSFDYLMRFVVGDPKTTVQVIGSEIVDFNRTDLLEIRDIAKNKIVLYVDRVTKLPVKMTIRRVDEKVTREEHYANWHKFQNVLTPLFIGRYTDKEKQMEIRLDAAVYNSSLPDNLFAAPKK